MSNVASESDQITFPDPDPLSFTAPLIKKTRQSVESTHWGKVQRVCTATRARDWDQFLHFVRPRAQCVPLLRSSFVDISDAPPLLLCTLSPSVHSLYTVQVLWGRWPFVCLTQVCQGPPWSTLVTKFHPGPPLSTLVFQGLPRSTQVFQGLPWSDPDEGPQAAWGRDGVCW